MSRVERTDRDQPRQADRSHSGSTQRQAPSPTPTPSKAEGELRDVEQALKNQKE
jgi:hypothetical protein